VKTNWSVPIAVAALVLTMITLVINMNQVSGADALAIERRIATLEATAGCNLRLERGRR
jgi:mannose/fructose/N-acetylgalactosamine-specific phosphotransferase system component IIC